MDEVLVPTKQRVIETQVDNPGIENDMNVKTVTTTFEPVGVAATTKAYDEFNSLRQYPEGPSEVAQDSIYGGTAGTTAYGTTLPPVYNATNYAAQSGVSETDNLLGSTYPTASSNGNKAADYASTAARNTYDTASTVANNTAELASETATAAYDTARNAANTAYDVSMTGARTAYDAASTAANTATELASNAAKTATDLGTAAARTTYNAASSAAHTAGDIASAGTRTAYNVSKAAAEKTAEGVSRTRQAATNLASEAAHAAARAPAYAKAAGQRAYVGVEHKAEVTDEIATRAYESTVHPLLSNLWWLFVTLPYDVAVWSIATAWYFTERVLNLGVGTARTATNAAVDTTYKASNYAGDFANRATDTATRAGETAGDVANRAYGEARYATRVAGNSAQEVANRAYEAVQPLLSTLWYIYVTLPYTLAMRALNFVWGTTEKAAEVGTDAARIAADKAARTTNQAWTAAERAAAAGQNTVLSAADIAARRAAEAANAALGMTNKAAHVAGQVPHVAWDTAATAQHAARDGMANGMNTVQDLYNNFYDSVLHPVLSGLWYLYVTLPYNLFWSAVNFFMQALERVVAAGQTAVDMAAEGANRAGHVAADLAHRAGETAADVTNKATAYAADLTTTAADTVSRAPGMAYNATATAAESATRAGQWAADTTTEAAHTVSANMHPLLARAWWLFVTLPYTLAVNALDLMWEAVTRMFTGAADTANWLAISFSNAVNKFADIAFRLMLGSLRLVNRSMDNLLNNTPALIRNALQSARMANPHTPGTAGVVMMTVGDEGATGAAREGSSSSSSSSSSDDERFPVEGVDVLVMVEEVDVARAANDVLHQVFDNYPRKLGLQGTVDNRSTLLSEARKLAWHAWMLVALQITAARTALKVTEGLIGWVAKTWMQLAAAGLALSVMGALAPAVGFAAFVAWASLNVLKRTERDFPVLQSRKALSSVTSLLELRQACVGADQSWRKASSLAKATAYTVIDIARVFTLGLATRLNLKVPTWVPGMSPYGASGVVAASTHPAVAEFNANAGAGPASAGQAIGAVPTAAY